ncbi:MAG: YihY/virulence factor BrkB family protein [Candidatus Dormibacteraeota bacterium]|uniref:YihY/virulence factor BrkB family protein n=1 Tax=Candidatus Dormiibacter inghamiae TaxID=3127013 RepID=A0A934NC54_9BACT|nr:YihY/virulence factor BrkB family protein [Candidatus Dormibacteraeota bacterium]MBJ7606959.1 YihY/virulence factor BrkB family protein [Candidatus Dormibacteraeota bacterium]
MKSLLERAQKSFPGRLLKAFGEAKGGNYAAGLAFNAFMSMFPLMLGILAIIGLVVRDPHLLERVQSVVIGVFPSDAHDALTSTLKGASQHSGLLGIISILGLIWSGSRLFANLEFALGEMYGVEQRKFLRQLLMTMAMMGIFVVALSVSVVLNGAAGLTPLSTILAPIVGAVVMIVFMTIIYRVVPNRSFELKEVLKGAILAGVLIELITLVFPIYSHLMHGFSTYGAAFSLFFLLATWLFFVSEFILLGAVLNRMVAGAPQEGGLVEDAAANDTETRGSEAAERQRSGGEGEEAAKPEAGDDSDRSRAGAAVATKE